MTTPDLSWIDAALTGARPQAVGALLRYFRNLDTAEEAFQEAQSSAEDGSECATRPALPGSSF